MDASTISTSPSHSDKRNQGLLDRLLLRPKSTKGSSSSRSRSRSRPRPTAELPDNLVDQTLSDTDRDGTTYLGSSRLEPEPSFQQLYQQQRQQHPQRQPRGQATAPGLPVQMAQPPLLKKKASFRDRIKSWQKPASTPTVIPIPESNQQPTTRFVYRPKHAAADFSRMLTSPTAPPPLSRRAPKTPFDEDRTLGPSLERLNVAGSIQLPEDDAEVVLKKTRGLSPPLQALGEIENGAVSEGRPRHRHGKQRDHSAKKPALEGPPLHRPHSGARHRSYQMAQDPWEASQTAAHVPIGSIPANSLSISNRIPAQGTENTPNLQEQQQPQPSPSRLETGRSSDFEAFLAQAEAEDRAQRELMLRSFSHHSALHSTNYVRPNPHRQYATVTEGELSGTTVATASRTSAGGSRSSRGGGSQRTGGQHYALAPGGEGGEESQQHASRSGHKKHESWSPSVSPDKFERKSPEVWTGAQQSSSYQAVPRSRKSQALPQPQFQQKPIVYGVDEKFNQPSDQQQQQLPRTIRRQTSITQRIAGYIKPARDEKAQQQTLYHSASRSGLGRSTSQRQKRSKGIETLVE